MTIAGCAHFVRGCKVPFETTALARKGGAIWATKTSMNKPPQGNGNNSGQLVPVSTDSPYDRSAEKKGKKPADEYSRDQTEQANALFEWAIKVLEVAVWSG